MSRRLFGTDGIRGVAGLSPLTPELVLALGRAVAHHFRQAGEFPKVVMGQDTRRSCSMLQGAMSAGLCAAGADVVDVGVLPTPAISHLVRELRACAGVMISASHNPFADNGIKLFGADGFKLSDEQELALEQALHNPAIQQQHLSGEDIGTITSYATQGLESYLERLICSLPPQTRLSGLRVVVDVGYGAAARAARPLFERLGADVTVLHTEADGQNINRGCGALHPERLQEVVRAQRADLGVALDGDADRLILVDEQGDVRDGDYCMAVLAEAALRRGLLPQKTVVATQMSNLGLELYLQRRGVELIRTGVGDRYVVQAMREGQHPLGGEQSGHVILLEHATTGDGLLAALQVAAEVKVRGVKLSELLEGWHVLPQVLLNVRLKTRKPLETLTSVMDAIERARQVLGPEGRVLVRFSGTEPLARVMIEGRDAVQIRQLAGEIAEKIAEELNA